MVDISRFDEYANFKDDEALMTPEYGPIPEGIYKLAIIEEGETKNGWPKLTIEVLEGKYKGRLLWETVCVGHQKKEVHEGAIKTFLRLERATGVTMNGDTSRLVNKPFEAKIRIEEGNEKYPSPSNRLAFIYAKGEAPKAQAAFSGVARTAQEAFQAEVIDVDETPF